MFWRVPTGNGRILLSLGIALRLLVFPFLSPLDSDYGHLALVKYVAEHHALFPLSTDPLAFHPPLYYVLAAPFYAITGTAKGAQLLSLLLSIFTLLIFYRLLYVENLIEGTKQRTYAFLLPCFLPQFVLYTLYVSNDTLAIFFGALIVLQVVRFVATPNYIQLIMLGLVEALALSTKSTFLVFLPVLFALVLLVCYRHGHSVLSASMVGLILLLLSGGLGSYKFIQNYREAKNPFISNLDFHLPWVGEQQASYRGPASFLDMDLLKLIKSPSMSPATEGAYPLVLYGTFWYQYVPESSFEGSRHPPYYYLGSVIYLFAFIPSVVLLIGLFCLLRKVSRLIPSFVSSRKEDANLLCSFTCTSFLLGNLALIISVALKYHVWSVMTGRLLFPSFCGVMVAFGSGADALIERRMFDTTFKVVMVTLVACFGLYFASEIMYRILHGLVPGAASLFK